MMRQYAASAVSDELIEAARVDGCSTLRIYWSVVLPALRPAAGVLGLLTFMEHWNSFLWPYAILHAGEPDAAGLAGATSRYGYYTDYSMVFAATAVATAAARARVHRVRSPDHRRHHGRCGQGVTTSQPIDVHRTVDAPTPVTGLPTPAPVSATTVGVRRFPEGFLWGAATAAYQIEGAAATDGRTPSIWDTFSEHAGRGRRRAHRPRRDRPLPPLPRRRRADEAAGPVARTGSRSRGRGCSRPAPGRPTRPGSTSTAGWSTSCSSNGIEPWLTLYHWDLPQPIEDAGGWPARDTAARFAEYAAPRARRARRPGAHWTTLNEPWCSAFLGYASGDHAPGRRDASLRRPGRAPPAARPRSRRRRDPRGQRPDTQVGITLNLYAISPASARAGGPGRGPSHRRSGQPVLPRPGAARPVPGGRGRATSRRSPTSRHVHDGDLAVISRPLSMLGINYYSRHVLAAPAARRRTATHRLARQRRRRRRTRAARACGSSSAACR